MSEYTEKLGRQVEYRRARQRQATEIEALRDQLLRLLPRDEPVEHIDFETVFQTALAIQQNGGELKETIRRLKIIADAIGPGY